jgi:CRISPR-associated protein Cas1
MSRPVPGMPPADLSDLVRVEDRLSFVYLERCIVHREDNAITASDERGVIHIPGAALNALLLGPGTRVSHAAIALLADSGATVVWVGESGVRYYAHGRGLASGSRLLIAQATLVSNQSSRLRVARDMYALRFPGEDVRGLTMQQLRGREGARVRRAYRAAAEHYRRRRGPGATTRPADFDGRLIRAQPRPVRRGGLPLRSRPRRRRGSLGCSPGLGLHPHRPLNAPSCSTWPTCTASSSPVPGGLRVSLRMAEEVDDIRCGDCVVSMRDAFYGGQLAARCAQRHQAPASARTTSSLRPRPAGRGAHSCCGTAPNVSSRAGGAGAATAYGDAEVPEADPGMVVLVLTACPAGLRGHVTRWLLEISCRRVRRPRLRPRPRRTLAAGARPREGRQGAAGLHVARNEQRLAFRAPPARLGRRRS